jgi:dipeptide/tripeptide permease
MLVAIGAAMFKPVIIGTVTKTTNEKTSSLGFGIFYMMVNIGGFVGPIVAGIVRGWSWEYVFFASAGWILVNLIVVIIFYKEPPRRDGSSDVRSLKKVLQDMVEVLGNGRFFLFVFGLLVVLVLGSKYTSDGAFTWGDIVFICGIWIVLNYIYDIFLRKSGDAKNRSWILSP